MDPRVYLPRTWFVIESTKGTVQLSGERRTERGGNGPGILESASEAENLISLGATPMGYREFLVKGPQGSRSMILTLSRTRPAPVPLRAFKVKPMQCSPKSI